VTSTYSGNHKTSESAAAYTTTYQRGYYAAQWERIERPLLENEFAGLREAGARVLIDLACGTGRILSIGERYFPRTIGFDVSYNMALLAKRTARRSQVVTASVDTFTCPIEADVVTAFRFFLNAEPPLRRDALRCAHRSLVRGGALLASIHVNASSPLGIAYRTRNALRGRILANTLGSDDFVSLVRSAGFDVERVEFYSMWPRLGHAFQGLSKALLPTAERAWKTLLPNSRRAQCFLVVARRV
jgi:SAM-dependent methyltransferase